MSTSTGIVLHHLEDSRSQRILWLLEELEVPYTIKVYKRTPERRAPKELTDVFPLGKAPIITDGNLTLAESGAIVEYLIEKYGKGRFKPSDEGFADNLYWTHFAEGSLAPMLLLRLLFKLIPAGAPFLVRPLLNGVFSVVDRKLVSPELAQYSALIENHLEKRGPWFSGGDGPTSADFMMSFTLEVFANRASDFLKPRTKEYIARFQSRPAYKRVLEKGGEYSYVLKE